MKTGTIANREPQRRLERDTRETAGDCLPPKQVFFSIHCEALQVSLEQGIVTSTFIATFVKI